MVAVLKTGGGAPTKAEFHAAIAQRADRWFAACLRITRDRALAEDAVQDALLSAWQKREQFQRGARLDTWIHRIAVNAALQLLRKQRPGIFEPYEHEVAADTPNPEDGVHARDLDEDLSAALRHLSDVERVCFVLKHLEQWRLREIADELDLNVGAVKQALFRGVRKLRDRMPALERINP